MTISSFGGFGKEVLRQPLEDSVVTIACALALVMLDMPRVKDRAWYHVLAHSMRAANATRWFRSTICAP
jgi:hypothetical protein